MRLFPLVQPITIKDSLGSKSWGVEVNSLQNVDSFLSKPMSWDGPSPGWWFLSAKGRENKKKTWFIIISPWLFRLWVNYYSWEIMVNYILAILRYAIPQFWRKFYMKYPSGTEMVDKRDPVYQGWQCLWHCEGGKPHWSATNWPCWLVIDVIGNYERSS